MALSQYSTRPLKRVHAPRSIVDPRGYRSCLRLEFDYQCVYCLALEREVGPHRSHGGFEVEHFKPKKVAPQLRSAYTNLLWACPECNRAKGDTWPSSGQRRMKRRWVNPCEESLAKHLLINGEKVEPQTETGRWMAKRLNLNEGEHLARRADRQRKPELIAALRTLILKLAPAERSMALEHLEELASLCVDASPHDPVDGCRCDAASMEVVTAPTPASAPAVVSERLENKQRVAELLAELGLSATVEQALSRKKR